jgi:hypothetical protein
MNFLPMTDYETASRETRREYDNQIARYGRVTNMKRTLPPDSGDDPDNPVFSDTERFLMELGLGCGVGSGSLTMSPPNGGLPGYSACRRFYGIL